MRNLDKAVTFLVEHVRDPRDDARQARDKIRKRVLYALATGDLGADCMLFDTGNGAEPPPRFVAWARAKWPSELQRFEAEFNGDGGSCAGFQDTAVGDVLPGDIGKCQDYLQQAYSGMRAMAKELSAATLEIERLRIIESKYEAIREKNRRNAKQPRKG